MRRRWCGAVLLMLFGGAALAAAQTPRIEGPLPPERAAESMDLEPGLKLELVAAEPLIAAPVAAAFDLQGRMFVVENRGYPVGPAPGEPPQGRIALLEDVDGDGVFDKRMEFADGLTFPNGILPWRDGAIVTCSPEILFLRDSDGDGRADVREVIFTGLSTEGSTQLRASHPTLAPDGWIYVTNGLSGGALATLRSPETPPLALGRHTFRFRPDFSLAELASGPAQFGMSFDDFGRQFVCYNRVQAQLVMLTPQAAARAPNVGFASLLHNCPIDLEAEPLAGHGAAAKIFPISQNITTADSHAGTFTAACGVTLVRGQGLPEIYRGGVLSCDPTANLVHFDQLIPQGAAIGARRLSGQTEFLRSSDSWFRPVFLTWGPEGALYVCDMYRKTIEHPDYLPVEVRKHTDFRSGAEMGRIWRVARSDLPRISLAGATRELREATPEEVVRRLADAEPWQRDTACRRMLEAPSEAYHAPLRTLLASDAPDYALALGAGVAEALGLQIDETLRNWLEHPSAKLREAAVRMLGGRIAGDAEAIARLAPLAADAEPRVRYELALALGARPAGSDRAADQAIGQLAARIAAKGPLDDWMRKAILCAISGREAPFLMHLKQADAEGRVDLDLLREASRLLALAHTKEKQPEAAARLLRAFEGSFLEQAAALAGPMELWRQRGWLQEEAFRDALGLGVSSPAMMQGLTALREVALKKIAAQDAPRAERIAAIGVVSLARSAAGQQALFAVLEVGELQRSALQALCAWRDAAIAAQLLAPARWEAYSPVNREELLVALLAAPEMTRPLVEELEAGAIPLSAIDSLKRRQLTSHRDAGIRARAEKLFGAIRGDRAAVYAALKEVAEQPGDAAQGRKVFAQACANCHRLNREGYQVGPDLFGVRNQPKAAILLHILVPDQEITQGFHAYNVLLADGRALQGLLAQETATSITLRLPQGKEETIPRDEIEEMTRSPLSLMPQGIENTLSRTQLADLLAYLKGEAEREASPPVDSPAARPTPLPTEKAPR